MRIVSTLLALALSLACGPGTPQPSSKAPQEPVEGGTVVIGVLSDIQGWNPYLAETAHTEEVLALVYPSLAVEQTDYADHPPSFEPMLAESWTFSDDHLELVFHLKPEARWSDGYPITSSDVVFTWQAQIAEEIAWPNAVIKDYITAVEAIDENTVRFTFDHVYPYQLMDANDGLILPAHAWSEIPFAEWSNINWSDKVIAGGPFLKQKHTPMQELVLARNPDFTLADTALLDRVVWRVIPDKNNLLTQLLSGTIDYMKAIPPDQIHQVAADPKVRLIEFSDRGYSLIIWNTRNTLFSDARVRRALTHAINRQAIIDTVYRGRSRPSLGPVLSEMWAFNDSLEAFTFSPSQAKVLLTAAGWKDHDGDGIIDKDGREFSFEILAPAENHTRQDIAMMVQENLARVGIKATPRTAEWGTLLSRLHTGDFDAVVHRWIEPTQVDLSEVWHTAEGDGFTLNFSGFSNQEVDELLDTIATAPDFESQKPLLDRVQEIIVDEQPYTFLSESVRTDGLHTRVEGATINSATPYFNLHEWYVTGPR